MTNFSLPDTGMMNIYVGNQCRIGGEQKLFTISGRSRAGVVLFRRHTRYHPSPVGKGVSRVIKHLESFVENHDDPANGQLRASAPKSLAPPQ